MAEHKLFSIHKGIEKEVDGSELAVAVIARAIDDMKRLDMDCRSGKSNRFKAKSDNMEQFRDGLSAAAFLLSNEQNHTEIREMWCNLANLDPKALSKVRRLFPTATKMAAQWGTI